MNRFFEWIGLKAKLHRSEHKPPFASERDLWWESIGENVGSQVNGKSDRFSRPVLILRKLLAANEAKPARECQTPVRLFKTLRDLGLQLGETLGPKAGEIFCVERSLRMML